jgi:ABC-2 type transport system permease protein
MDPKLPIIIRREYFHQVRRKAFWISTFLIPAIGLVFVGVQVLLNRSLEAKGKIAVVDMTGRLYDSLVSEKSARASDDEKTTAERKEKPGSGKAGAKAHEALEFLKVEATPESLPEVRKKLNADVQAERVKAWMLLDARTLDKGTAEYRAKSVKADFILREQISAWLSRAATKERLKDRGVDPALYDAARVKAELDVREAKDVETGETGKNVGFNLAVSAILFFLIYGSLFAWGSAVMRGVLEEKNNRIVEVVISSVRPTTLMLGKILGIGLAGLTQYAVWASLALVLSAPAALAMIGFGDAPSLPLHVIGAFVLFFVLGYFLYASLYAALAAPFNTEAEAQQFIMIPMAFLILAATTWFFAFNSPDGTMATVLSLVPFTAPLIMFMRITVQTPPLWQIALSLTLLLLTIWAVAWFAGRVYRVGILMYGKKPTVPEIIRWARTAE